MYTVASEYRYYFPNCVAENWDGLRHQGQQEAIRGSAQPDMVVVDARSKTWQDVVKRIAILALKTVLFPWGLYCTAKTLCSAVSILNVCPAQLHLKSSLDALRQEILQKFNRNGFVARHVILEKNGVRYSGLMLGHENTLSNGKWALHAMDNNQPVERLALFDAVKKTNYLISYIRNGYNILCVNGPNVGRSEGVFSPVALGRSQEIGIRFLECAIKAQRIVLVGFFFGGLALGQGILQHEFRPDVHYCVIRMNTSRTLSAIVEKLAGKFGKRVFNWLDYEIDSVAASRKLQQLHIPEVIIENQEDEMMEGVFLGKELQDLQLCENKVFQMIPSGDHHDDYYEEVREHVASWDRQLDLKECEEAAIPIRPLAKEVNSTNV